jgi:hypothetical protein
MRALTVCPGEPGTVSLGEVSEPAEGDGLLLAGGEDQVDLGGLYRHLVLTNQIIIATMTAHRRHFQEAMEMLCRADRDWLAGLITRRLELPQWEEALQPQQEQVKTVIRLDGQS